MAEPEIGVGERVGDITTAGGIIFEEAVGGTGVAA